MLWKEILEIRWKAAIGLLVFWTLAMMGPGLYWYLQNDPVARAQFQALPPEVVGRLTDYQALVHSNWFGQSLLQMGTILAVIVGCSAIAGETSKRTIEFLLSKPVSRLRLLLTKVAVGVGALAVIVLTSSLLVYPASLILGLTVEPGSLVLASILSTLGLSVMFSLSILFSTLFDDVIKTAAVSLILALVLSIPGFFKGIAGFSIYNHMQDFASFQQGTIPLADVVFLLAAFVALVSASYLVFRTREF